MQIQTSKSQRELKPHGDFFFPVLVSEEKLSNYEFETFCWHWHPEIELTLVEEGSMIYEINGHPFLLKKGNVLFGNANTLHSGHKADEQDCVYRSVTFDPKIIYGFENSLLYTKYVAPLVSNHSLSAFLFDETEAWHGQIRKSILNIIDLWESRPACYELKLQREISEIWLVLTEHIRTHQIPETSLNEKELDRLKHILAYLHENYTQKITLDEIASSVHICKNECCRFFKKHMQESLFDYLLRYRIEQSLPYLRSPRYTITDAAFLNGFSDAGYYSKVFHKQIGCSPREFRKKTAEDNT